MIEADLTYWNNLAWSCEAEKTSPGGKGWESISTSTEIGTLEDDPRPPSRLKACYKLSSQEKLFEYNLQ